MDEQLQFRCLMHVKLDISDSQPLWFVLYVRNVGMKWKKKKNLT